MENKWVYNENISNMATKEHLSVGAEADKEISRLHQLFSKGRWSTLAKLPTMG